MDIYAQNILDRYKKPYHKDKKFVATVSHTEANHSCGDIVGASIQIDHERIKEYGFQGHGCAICVASADILGDIITNMSVDAVLDMAKEEIYEALGIDISLRRSKCALLALLAVQNAILEHNKKPLRQWTYYHLS